ncbi:hypothetical protein NMG60_11005212 [Bertholletia excelsa]
MLSIKDMEGVKAEPNWSKIDYLVTVAEVARLRYDEEKRNMALDAEEYEGKTMMIKKDAAITTERAAEPELPDKFKKIISEINPSAQPKLLIEKRLYKTDVNKCEGRLSIPERQTRSEFLRDEEKIKLSTYDGKNWEEMEVRLIEPSGEENRIRLKKWVMRKEDPKKKAVVVYALTTYWNRVWMKNQLEEGTFIQLWSFRDKASQLCLALVRVPSIGENVVPVLPDSNKDKFCKRIRRREKEKSQSKRRTL